MAFVANWHWCFGDNINNGEFSSSESSVDEPGE
jgi:hypothetical protein